jgi:RHS repeat-associated protein
VYDGPNLAQELDGTGTLVASYMHGPAVDHPFSMTRGGVTYFFLYDRLGSVIGLTDGAGQQVASYRYDAWGNVTASGPAASLEQPFRFTGREWDTDSGLYYYRARYYDPQVGRFISRDPIGRAGGTNLYAYVDNNPLNWVDPAGLSGRRGAPPAPPGYEYAGMTVVENHVLKYDTVPPGADESGDAIIMLESETIVKDGRLVLDRIVTHTFTKKKEFRCV